MRKKNLLPVIVLVSICVIVAAILGAVNMITSQKIEENRLAAIAESLEAVKPSAESSFDDVTADYKDTATKTTGGVYFDSLTGHFAVTVQAKGYNSSVPISMTVLVTPDGKIAKVVVTEEQESHGKADVEKLPESFVGKDGNSIGAVSGVSGATVTSNAMKSGVKDALITLGFATDEEILPHSDAQLEKLAADMFDGSKGVEDITPEDRGTYVKRVYREVGGAGYAVYVNAYYYGQMVCDVMIAFDNNDTIIEIEKYSWVVGHAWGGAVPPTDAEVDAFFNSFVGKSAEELRKVELISGTTGTTLDVRHAIIDAANAIPTDRFPTARVVGILIASVAIAAIAAVVFVKRRRRAG